MKAEPRGRLTSVWAALSLITLLSWWIGSRHSVAFDRNATVTFSVLALAAVKIRLIMSDFMEVRHAPALLRHLTDGWIVFVIGSLMAIYGLGVGVHP
jgi:Prokaryotic Cytochrome C oxidase subunit IV